MSFQFSVQCPTLDQVIHGDALVSTDGATTAVLFTCDVGYTMDGLDTYTCLTDGTWASPQPTCGKPYPAL